MRDHCDIHGSCESTAIGPWLMFFLVKNAWLHFFHVSTGRSGCRKNISIPLTLDSHFFSARLIRRSQGQLSFMRIGLGRECQCCVRRLSVLCPQIVRALSAERLCSVRAACASVYYIFVYPLAIDLHSHQL